MNTTFYDPVAKQDVTIYLEPKLKKLWNNIRCGNLEKLNEDRVYLVDGRERSGKSLWAFQQAKYIDPNFTLDNICLTSEQFLYQIRNAPKGSVIVFDEAFRGLSSKASRSNVNKEIVEALMEVGQRNLVIFIVLPTFFLLEIYAAVFRSEALFHIYKIKTKNRDGLKRLRGYKIYNYTNKKYLYLRGKPKYFSYAQPKITRAKGRILGVRVDEEYYPYKTFPMKEYKEKKREAFSKKDEKVERPDSKFMIQRNLIIKWLYETKFKSLRKLSKALLDSGVDISPQMIGNIVADRGKVE